MSSIKIEAINVWFQTEVEIEGLDDMVEKDFDNLTDEEVLDLMDVIDDPWGTLEGEAEPQMDGIDTDFYEVTGGYSLDDLQEKFSDRYVRLKAERNKRRYQMSGTVFAQEVVEDV